MQCISWFQQERGAKGCRGCNQGKTRFDSHLPDNNAELTAPSTLPRRDDNLSTVIATSNTGRQAQRCLSYVVSLSDVIRRNCLRSKAVVSSRRAEEMDTDGATASSSTGNETTENCLFAYWQDVRIFRDQQRECVLDAVRQRVLLNTNILLANS